MKAREFRYQLLVTIDTLLMEGENFDQHVDEVRERITSQLAGHRTSKRLADSAEVSFTRIISENSREL